MNNIIPLFSMPVVKVNINRKFTKDELQLLLYDIPMWKDVNSGNMFNHRSKDFYLFDTFV